MQYFRSASLVNVPKSKSEIKTAIPFHKSMSVPDNNLENNDSFSSFYSNTFETMVQPSGSTTEPNRSSSSVGKSNAANRMSTRFRNALAY